MQSLKTHATRRILENKRQPQPKRINTCQTRPKTNPKNRQRNEEQNNQRKHQQDLIKRLQRASYIPQTPREESSFFVHFQDECLDLPTRDITIPVFIENLESRFGIFVRWVGWVEIGCDEVFPTAIRADGHIDISGEFLDPHPAQEPVL
jgi:hypothetical protein